MCDICGCYPCMRGCPNDEAPEVYICASCKEPIVEGDECFELDGEHYHEDCFKDAAVGILMEEYGAVRKTAEVDTW